MKPTLQSLPAVPFTGLWLLSLILHTATATVYLDEQFDYTDGPLVQVSSGRWLTHSGTPGQVDVVSGAAYLTQAETEDVSVAVTNTPGGPVSNGVLYAGFTVRFTALPSGTGGYFWHYRDSGTFNFRARVFATVTSASPGKFRFGIANGGNNPVIISNDCDLETQYKLVVRYDLDNTNATLWINPTSESSTVNRASATDTTTPVPITYVCLRQSLSAGAGMGSLYVDNLVVGTAFTDVHTPGGPPTITTIPDQYIAAGTSTGPLPFEVEDVETPADQLLVMVQSDNVQVVPNQPQHLHVQGTGRQRTLTVSPVPGREGLVTIRLTVRDADGLESATSFAVYVGMPTISTLADQVAPTNTPVGPLEVTVHDAETPDQLIVVASSLNEALVPSGNLILSGSGTTRTLRIIPAPNASGTATINLVVSDGIWNVQRKFRVTFHPKFGLVLGDSFDYPDGLLVERAAPYWSTHSGTTGQVQVVGGQVLLNRAQTEDVSAGFTNFLQALDNGIVLFTGLKLRVTETPTTSGGDYFVHFRDVGTVNYRGRLFVTTNGAAPGMYRLGIANSSATPTAVLPRDLSPNMPVFVLLRYNVDTATTTLWVNPADPSSPSVTAVDPATPVSLYYFSLRQSGGIGSLVLDQVKVGTAWEDVWEAAGPQPERLQWNWDGQDLTLRWTQPSLRLQSASTIEGPFTDVVGAVSPYRVPTSGQGRFYRLVY
ncbi:MAG: hypothetical protein RMN51_10825 [Verrucomicrobiota bacterium]|nr:hypothetical protein [Limisphaera sp.]MDW8382581.1 hypothetical protein [Verrucomicrobiota bacterium]